MFVMVHAFWFSFVIIFTDGNSDSTSQQQDTTPTATRRSDRSAGTLSVEDFSDLGKPILLFKPHAVCTIASVLLAYFI